MTYVFDIDGTICKKLCELENEDYKESTPYEERIEKINKLYDEGHTIIYQTARGMGRSQNENPSLFENLTQKQLQEWGVKYHELKLGKPMYDLFIDDKNINTADWE